MAFHKEFDAELDDAASAGPACMHLRSKGMYVTGRVDPSEDHEGMGDGHCWCNLTQRAIGPDDDLVSRRGCRRGRRCFQIVI